MYNAKINKARWYKTLTGIDSKQKYFKIHQQFGNCGGIS